jgi:rhamnogalacturonyl hydrolase YesR
MIENLINLIRNLDLWFEQQEFKGFDPYDIKGLELSLKIQKFGDKYLIGKVIRKLYFSFIDLFPNYSRKLLRVKPLENAKGIGLVLNSYAKLYKMTGDKVYLEKALIYANWLKENRGKNYSGYNWGYPFDWQSVIFIPKGTPSSVVTYTVGSGFWELYQATNEKEYLDICVRICDFFTKDLNITYEDKDKICHSYTPIDDYQVHNANLFVGEFLVKIGKEVNNESWFARGIKCANFAIYQQQKEGFIPYWGLDQTNKYSNGKIKNDHYHMGFEIRMLYSIWKMTNLSYILNSWQKYFNFYLNYMFNEQGIPKFTMDSYYPVNIHSIAESILCLSKVNEYYKNLNDKIENIIKFATEELEFKEGQYCYLIKKLPFIGEYKLKIPMYRWGQAWMLLALTTYLETINENKKNINVT